MLHIERADNYCALVLSILTGCGPAEAFDRLDNIGDARMAQLRRQGYTYPQIGEMYGRSASAVYDRLNRRQRRRGVSDGTQ